MLAEPFGRVDSPMPRAQEHVQALHDQYEGLMDTLHELEGQLKRVSPSLHRRVVLQFSLLLLCKSIFADLLLRVILFNHFHPVSLRGSLSSTARPSFSA